MTQWIAQGCLDPGAVHAGGGKSGSFLKKRTKKLLLLAVRVVPTVSGRGHGGVAKVFCFFFSKKKRLPHRLLNWKLRRAFALPYFFRSTTRLSRVRNPAVFRTGRRSGSK
jgi:hypothetical protein